MTEVDHVYHPQTGWGWYVVKRTEIDRSTQMGGLQIRNKLKFIAGPFETREEGLDWRKFLAWAR